MTTTPIKKTRLSAAIALVAGLSLALSACGWTDTQQDGKGSAGEDQPASSAESDSSGEGSDSAEGEGAPPAAVYNFDQAKVLTSDAETPWTTSDQSFVIELSDELKAAMPQGKGVAVERYTVTQKAFPTGLCRLDVAVTYTDGGLESVKKSDPGDDHGSVGEAVMANLVYTGNHTEVVEAVPSDDEVDEGSFITSDHSTLTFVDDCSEGTESNDLDEFVEIRFPYLDRGDIDQFADTKIFVVGSGQDSESTGVTSVIYGGAQADVSASGKWKVRTED